MPASGKKSPNSSKVTDSSSVSLVDARKANETIIHYLMLRRYPKPAYQPCTINREHRRGGVKLCTGATKLPGESYGYWFQMCVKPDGQMSCYRRHREPPLDELNADEELRLALIRREYLRPQKRSAPANTLPNAHSNNNSNTGRTSSSSSNSSQSSQTSRSLSSTTSTHQTTVSSGDHSNPSSHSNRATAGSHSPTSRSLSSAATHQTTNSSGDHSGLSSHSNCNAADGHSTSYGSNNSISYSPNSSYQPSSQSQNRTSGLESVSLGSTDTFSSAMPSYPSSQQSLGRSPLSRSHRKSHRLEPYKRSLSSLADSTQEDLTTVLDLKPRVSVPTARNTPLNAVPKDAAKPRLSAPSAVQARAHRRKAQPPHPEDVIDLCTSSPELLPKKAAGPVVPIDLCSPSPPPPPPKCKRSLTASGSLPAGVSYTRCVSPAAVGVTIEVFIFFSRVSYHETKIYYFVEDCEFQLSDQRGVFKSFGYTEEMSFNIFQPAKGEEAAAWVALGWKDIISVKGGDRIVLKLDGLEVDTADALLLAED